MHKIISFFMLPLLAATLFTACSDGAADKGSLSANTNVKTGGSTSVEKVMNALIYQFQNDNANINIDYEANGSGDGISNTKSGLYEIGHSSRELKTDGSEDGLNATAYAIDGIAIIVHKSNPINNLTKQDIFDIYTGRIDNWSELGGDNVAISPITRESGSGTRSAMAEIIGLEKKKDGVLDESTKLIASANEANNTGAVQTQIAQNPNAIGYISFSDIDATKVKTLSFEGVEISVDSVYDDSYKLKRSFYLLTKADTALSPAAQAFMNFVKSAQGQAIIESNKLLPVQ